MEIVAVVIAVGLVIVVSLPSKARPVDMGPAKVKHQRVVIDERMVFDAVTNGVPGSWSDRDVFAAIHQIEQSKFSNEEKYELFDALYFKTVNNHAHGMAADVINDIFKATDKVMR